MVRGLQFSVPTGLQDAVLAQQLIGMLKVVLGSIRALQFVPISEKVSL